MQPLALLASGLVAGLVAGTASCTAVQGGLLVGLTSGGCERPSRDPVLVAWFLAGRLVSYSAAGVLLGLVGSAVSLPPEVRALLLVAAGIMVIAYATRLLRRRRQSGCDETPRREASSAVRSAIRNAVGSAPLLGAATILIPCGVTLGMEMVAVSSGSPLGGAAVMAGFVIGTAPAFALLGWVLRRVSRTRLARLAGVAALVAGLWTVGSGVSLGGWLAPPGSAITESTLAAPGSATTEAGPGPATDESTAARTVTVWATRDGYRPAMVTARAGVPVDIVFKLADQGCTRTVTIAGRDFALPATVRLPSQRPGSLRYVCGMGMYIGYINFS
ncbi:sulfite exporter TauE/SafE family protein [Nonomuraea guangzhouensis]|uniref:Sulfite exporter TauE/SafE family protein n=1 Tax=Nonomuraea guangzhouensis TaxID=1291555 RepID=A0ABW4GH84_9ACTN|nr:sulfite exporter TauE/SafE family protein [Nonomuraea guangzhouensis]